MKKLTCIFTTFLLVLLVLSACQNNKADINADAKAIHNLEDQWSSALQVRDMDKVLSFFASEGVEMDPNLPIFVGPKAIREVNESWLSDTTILFKTFTYTIDPIEVSASGDLGYARGTSRVKKTTPKGPVEIRTKWVDIWKKIDGKWKVVVNISNSDNPSAGR
jgi:ketosteroid isomerase-like protein